MSTPRIALVASRAEAAQRALAELRAQVEEVPVEQAEVIVALGGDGFMLQTLHRFRRLRIPVYGMKLGSVGFLMNLYRAEQLYARLAAARPTRLEPLAMHAVTEAGGVAEALAINEVSLLRQTKQAAKIRVWVNGVIRVDEMICDGVMVATPVGSTAYNFSAHGPILPLDARVLALTPLAPFRPRRWRGAILPWEADVRLEILDAYKRPVSATADATEVRDVTEVQVRLAPEQAFTVLFDPEHGLEERILAEQFSF